MPQKYADFVAGLSTLQVASWKEKYCTLSQIMWNLSFSEEVIHKSVVSGYFYFSKISLIKTAMPVSE